MGSLSNPLLSYLRSRRCFNSCSIKKLEHSISIKRLCTKSCLGWRGDCLGALSSSLSHPLACAASRGHATSESAQYRSGCRESSLPPRNASLRDRQAESPAAAPQGGWLTPAPGHGSAVRWWDRKQRSEAG